MGDRREAVAALQASLGYTFKDAALLERALTHSSVGDGAKTIADNEVLEFLGDRVLGLLAAETLAGHYPEAKEGELARRLNSLVSGEACATVARALGMGPALRVSPTTVKTGVRDTDSVLGGAFEALMAAVYLEAGLDQTRETFLPHLRENFASGGQGARDPKTLLQEWAQAKGKPLPRYEVISRTGSDHEPTFTVEVTVEGFEAATARGRSRREAEKAAALALLKREGATA